MTSLARYHGRSPRYILNTEDDSLIRVAGPQNVPWEEATSIRNVSLTGLAFVAPNDLCPLLGEVIKIQFNPPGAKQMASYAIVIRIDAENDSNSLVAVQFYKMEMGHRIALAQGLSQKIKDARDSDGNSIASSSFNVKNIPSLVTLSLLATAYLLAMWALLSVSKHLPHFFGG